MTFTCFGEILWDVFPDRRYLGGAPLNVAYYLNQLGHNSQLISAVGDDELGEEALNIISKSGLATDSITRIADKETGQVLVSLDESGCAKYEFRADAAWDYISLPVEQINYSEDHTLVFGSLACRGTPNQQTLDELINHYRFRVFDLNLRPPFDDLSLTYQLMQKAELIKMNDKELVLLCHHLGVTTPDLAGQLTAVLENCNAKSICVTRGAQGAVLNYQNKLYSHPAYPTSIKDTVGAGDAFLAGLISELAKSGDPNYALSVACAIGSLVAGQAGAQSPVSGQTLDQIVAGGALTQ